MLQIPVAGVCACPVCALHGPRSLSSKVSDNCRLVLWWEPAACRRGLYLSRFQIVAAVLSFDHMVSPRPQRAHGFKLGGGFIFRFGGSAMVSITAK